MYIIEVTKYPDRKKKAIVVYDNDNPSVRYVIDYINHNEELFKQALVDSQDVIYIREDKSE